MLTIPIQTEGSEDEQVHSASTEVIIGQRRRALEADQADQLR